MKVGDMIYPKDPEKQTGQIPLPFWNSRPALIVAFVDYISEDTKDCQSDTIEDKRYLILEEGNLLYMTPFMLELFYECR